jgi:hypothetical protein
MDINIPADYKPSDADRAHAEDRQELARLLAKTHLPGLVTRLVENSLDPSASHKQIMDTTDYLYRVSGLSAKQEKKEGPTGFSIQINIPQAGGAPTTTTTIEAVAEQFDDDE